MQSVAWVEIASTLWQDLKRRYSQGDVYRVAELEEKIFAMKQGDFSITSYFTKLKCLSEDLDNLQPIPGCSYGLDCNCGLGTIRCYRNQLYVVRLLRAVVSQIMLLKPIPDINEVLSLLTQQERQWNPPVIESTTLLNNTTTQFMNFRGRDRGRGARGPPQNLAGRGILGRGKLTKVCTHCGKNSHLVDSCFQIVEYPPNWTKPSVINNIQAGEEIDDETSSILSSHKEVNGGPEQMFTQDQYKALMAMLKQFEATSSINQISTSTFPPSGSPNVEDDWCN